MNTSLALAIAAAAAVAAPARFLVDRWVTNAWTSGRRMTGWSKEPWVLLPAGLLVVNTVGSLIAGVLLVIGSSGLQTVLLVGFCGAFTTFSGFGWDLARLWSGARGVFWTFLIAMPAACIAAFQLGWAFGHAVCAECLR